MDSGPLTNLGFHEKVGHGASEPLVRRIVPESLMPLLGDMVGGHVKWQIENSNVTESGEKDRQLSGHDRQQIGVCDQRSKADEAVQPNADAAADLSFLDGFFKGRMTRPGGPDRDVSLGLKLLNGQFLIDS